MTTRAAACGVMALTMALAGCADNGRQAAGLHPLPNGPGVPCNAGVCEITVTVAKCDSGCCASVDKPVVAVTSARDIRWEIVTPGFVFASNGIAFDPPNPQFVFKVSPHPNEFRVHDAKSLDGDFPYYVNVQGCAPLDPWVRNQ